MDSFTYSVIEHGIELIENQERTYGADLHNALYNEDYFIIGTDEAKGAMEDYGVFEAIARIVEYENFNFGEVSTDFTNPEKVVNMLAFVIGEEVLSECPHLSECWDKMLTAEDLEIIENQLKQQIADSQKVTEQV